MITTTSTTTDRAALLAHMLTAHGWDSNPAGISDDDLDSLREMHDDDHEQDECRHGSLSPFTA